MGRKQNVVINGTKSSWTDVNCRISQGSILGPPFVVFFNDMSYGVTSTCKLFADDPKIYGPVDTDQGIQTIQKDLTQLVGWSKKWQMGHIVDKCKSLHLGNQNPGHQYTMSGNPLVKTSAEIDLGVMVDENLKFHVLTSRVISKAFQILAVVNKSFVNLDEFTLPLLFKTLI